MYYDDRSDFGAIIAGMVFLLISLLLIGIASLKAGFNLNFGMEWEIEAMGTVFTVLGILGLIITGFVIYKGFFVEGVLFGVIACWMIFFEPGVIFAIVLAVVLALIAVMSFLEKQKEIAILAVVLIVSVILIRATNNDTCVGIGGIVTVIAAIAVLVLTFLRWREVQNYIEDIENECLDNGCCPPGSDCHCKDDCPCEKECPCEDKHSCEKEKEEKKE